MVFQHLSARKNRLPIVILILARWRIPYVRKSTRPSSSWSVMKTIVVEAIQCIYLSTSTNHRSSLFLWVIVRTFVRRSCSLSMSSRFMCRARATRIMRLCCSAKSSSAPSPLAMVAAPPSPSPPSFSSPRRPELAPPDRPKWRGQGVVYVCIYDSFVMLIGRKGIYILPPGFACPCMTK